MFFAKLFDFSKTPILVLWIVIFYVLNVKGFARKKSIFSLTTLMLSMLFLIIHVCAFKGVLSSFNIISDFVSIIMSISFYLYLDDIESRRKVISEVFENRYKNRRKK